LCRSTSSTAQQAARGFPAQSIVVALRTAGLIDKAPVFFSWLGVTPYLSERSVMGMFEAVARHPGGAQIVFDYANPAASIPDARLRQAQEKLAAMVAAEGEPFRSYFDTEALHTSLRSMGFREIEDLGRAAIAERYFDAPSHNRSDRGGHVARASTGIR
jgi:O-methyltransferase involved in polyketide biosynthesis